MASRPTMARANFKKYTEITNPLAGTYKAKDSGKASSTIQQTVGGDDDDDDNTTGKEGSGTNNDEEDPFGLSAIMAEEAQGEGRGVAGRGGENDDEEDEEEDPFGLGVIMASGVADATEAADASQGHQSSGTKRGAPDYPPRRHPPPPSTTLSPSPSSAAAAAAAVTAGSYFTERHAAGNAPPTSHHSNTSSSRPFIAAKRFDGARPGYVFQLGKSGLGYYTDKHAQRATGKTAGARPNRGRLSAGVGDAAVPTGGRGRDVTAGGSSSISAGREGQQQERARPVVDVTAAAQKLGPLLLKPKKAAKAASLLADLMGAEMQAENARLFFRALRPLAEQPSSEAALASGEGAARAFQLLVERKDWVGGAAEGVRIITWELLFGLRHEFKTDDSFQFARAIKRLRSAIEALGDSTGGGGGGGGDDSGDGASDAAAGGAGQSTSSPRILALERKVAVIEIMREAFKSYHLAWARSSIEPAFKAAADRRCLFPEGELRDALDYFTDAITKRQRNPGGLMAPPSRTVRAHNSVAHPTLNKRSDVIR